MTAIDQRMTLEEFLKLPDDEPALEFADGIVTQKESPKGPHSVLQGEFVARINGFAIPRRLARAFPELRVTLAGVSRVPDVSVYSWNRIPVDKAGEVANDFLEPPDIAVEIVSPGQSVNGLLRRCLWYVENGVTVAILVDPIDRSMILFRPEQLPLSLSAEEDIDLNDVLPEFELTVEQDFGSLLHRKPST